MNDYSFDELKVSMSEEFVCEIREDKLSFFREMTGDINPLHTDPEFAKNFGFRDKVVYGMLSASLISTLGGCFLPGKKCLIHQVDAKFVKPVYVGDTLTVSGTVSEIHDSVKEVVIKVRIINQDNITVLKGILKAGVLGGTVL